MKRKNIILILCLSLVTIPWLSGCSESSIQSYNLSREADNFGVLRRLRFINTMTDQELFIVEGNFSINYVPERSQLEITAKTGANTYQKHYLGISPTTVYVCEQLEWKEEDKYSFKIILNPALPNIEIN